MHREPTPIPIEAYVVTILPGRPGMQPGLKDLLDGATDIARALLDVAPASTVEINAGDERSIVIRLTLSAPEITTGESLRYACREAYGRHWPAGQVTVAHDFEFPLTWTRSSCVLLRRHFSPAEETARHLAAPNNAGTFSSAALQISHVPARGSLRAEGRREGRQGRSRA